MGNWVFLQTAQMRYDEIAESIGRQKFTAKDIKIQIMEAGTGSHEAREQDSFIRLVVGYSADAQIVSISGYMISH